MEETYIYVRLSTALISRGESQDYIRRIHLSALLHLSVSG